MSKHTPGPWKYNYYSVESKHYIEGAGSNPIAELSPLQGVGSEETANGFLIAAAPELLQWAKELLRNIEGHDLSEFRVELNGLYEAIKKAEGKE